jgi:hypothetical protein
MKDSFILYNSFYEPIKSLSDEQLGKLFRAVFDYTTNGNITEEKDILIAFMFIKNQLDIDNEKYLKICERNKMNGQKGGRPKKPKKPNGLSGNPKEPKKPDNDNDNDNDNKKENNKKKKFGEFNNVLLTEEEYAKLENNNLLFYIEKLSAYLESTGKRYKSHYATILSWSRKEKQDNNKSEETKLTKVGNGAFIIGG